MCYSSDFYCCRIFQGLNTPSPDGYFVGFFFSFFEFMSKSSIDIEIVLDHFYKTVETKLEIYGSVFPLRHLINSNFAQVGG